MDVHLADEKWVNAPEFIPGVVNSYSNENTASGTTVPLSYAQAVDPSSGQSSVDVSPLCPYAENSGYCKKVNCSYLHGDYCDMCGKHALHPQNDELRKKHTNVRI